MQEHPMKHVFDQDLKKIERREWQLWILTLAILVLVVGVTAATNIIMLGEPFSDAGGMRFTVYKALGGLLVLIALFSLYVLHARMIIGRMRSLLVEISNLSTSSVELDGFLSAISSRIAHISSVDFCQMAILAESGRGLRIRSAHVPEEGSWTPQTERIYPLEQLTACRQAIETLKPVIVNRKDMEHESFSPEAREFLTGGSNRIRSTLVVPMAAKGRTLGVMTLGGVQGFNKARFTASRIVLAQALAGHAASAIDQTNLEKQVVRDPLTGLYNRRHFNDRLQEEISRANRNKHILAVLLCDLDRFKTINDTRGHQVGDETLKAVSKSILDSTRGTDLVFRWGGDEIVVALSKTSRDGSLIAAERIRNGVRNAGKASQLDLDISIGIVLYPEHGGHPDDLIRVADRALYIAKKTGEKIHFGEEEYRLDQQSVKVVFQPVVDIWSDKVLGYEALARDPHGKLSVPELFKKYSAIGQLNELKQICFKSQLRVAQEVKLERLFINADFDVISKLEPIDKSPSLDVVIELSELEALHDLKNHLEVARKWRDKGYKFAVDDFGAGFISLPFIASFVPEYIKVDRSTMLMAVSSEKFKGFLKPLLQALRTYSTEGIIAEGIEQEKELNIVKELGIFLVQGFLLGKPQALN